MKRISLEICLERSLCDHPELIDDSLRGIRPGLEVLGESYSTLKRQDHMPNGRIADIVFVEKHRITVVELKNADLTVSDNPKKEDVVDQILDYLGQCRIKYPDRNEYRGFIVGTGIPDRAKLTAKLMSADDDIAPLVFGLDIPTVIKTCDACGRAIGYSKSVCVCRAGL
jgi:hypothetical protein